MRDQADQLRNLALRAMQAQVAQIGPPPRLLVLTGGKGGVGTTTLSINLAVAMAQNGKRVVLVDADLQRADVAPLCSLEDSYNLADVLTSRRDIHEVLQRGPAGIQVLPGQWAPQKRIDCSEIAQQRLLNELTKLGRHTDVVVVDTGSDTGEVVRRFWQSADRILLVTTSETVSIMDAYATIKALSDDSPPTRPIGTIVNQLAVDSQARNVHHRIDVSCRRFLGFGVEAAGSVPVCLHQSTGEVEPPWMVASPTTEAARATDRIAVTLLAEQTAAHAAA